MRPVTSFKMKNEGEKLSFVAVVEMEGGKNMKHECDEWIR